MDDDSGAADAPIGDPVAAGPAGKPAPPTSRAVAMFAIVFLALGLIAAGSWFVGSGTSSPTSTFCTAEARIGPNGEMYGRDPGKGCKFVDADGNVLPGQ
jgi:hypothetical protein